MTMPVGNLPNWTQSYTQDFLTDAPIGQIANVYGTDMRGYSDVVDTSGNGLYKPDNVLSVHDSMLDFYVHTGAAGHETAAPTPFGFTGKLYGRYSFSVSSDLLPRYKMAFLLWPQTRLWTNEIDFPETDLDGTQNIQGYVHNPANVATNSLAVTSGTDMTDGNKHICTIEWTPNGVVFFLDGAQIGSTIVSPNEPMYLALQVETQLDGGAPEPDPATQGHILVDWIVAYDYTPVAVAGSTRVIEQAGSATSLIPAAYIANTSIKRDFFANFDVSTYSGIALANGDRWLSTALPPVVFPNPTASFTSSVSNLVVSFNGTASLDYQNNPVASYAWSFGDGSIGSGATPSHTYASAGTYTVGLIVTDSGGRKSSTLTHNVSPTNAAPTPTQGPSTSIARRARGTTDDYGRPVVWWEDLSQSGDGLQQGLNRSSTSFPLSSNPNGIHVSFPIGVFTWSGFAITNNIGIEFGGGQGGTVRAISGSGQGTHFRMLPQTVSSTSIALVPDQSTGSTNPLFQMVFNLVKNPQVENCSFDYTDQPVNSGSATSPTRPVLWNGLQFRGASGNSSLADGAHPNLFNVWFNAFSNGDNTANPGETFTVGTNHFDNLWFDHCYVNGAIDAATKAISGNTTAVNTKVSSTGFGTNNSLGFHESNNILINSGYGHGSANYQIDGAVIHEGSVAFGNARAPWNHERQYATSTITFKGCRQYSNGQEQINLPSDHASCPIDIHDHAVGSATIADSTGGPLKLYLPVNYYNGSPDVQLFSDISYYNGTTLQNSFITKIT